MPKYIPDTFVSIIGFFLPVLSFTQVNGQPDMFGNQVFVENKGQFDSWVRMDAPIRYAVNSNDKIFFTGNGLTFKLVKPEEMSEHEREEKIRREGKAPEPENRTYVVNMRWEGCSENLRLEPGEVSGGYYTFGEKGFENVKANGYRKLIYKDLYPGIDAEYTVPDKGGIKYSLIVHPGADLSKVKMKYSGDVDKVLISANGNILIKTPAGDIIDHAPLSFYKETAEEISSRFKLTGNSVSFDLPAINSVLQTIIIDPWTITPTSLATNNAAFDVDYDNAGNVYVSGGTSPFKLSKLSSTGTLLWTYTNPASWYTYTKFCLLRNSGTVFIGQGYNSLTTTAVMKISASGTLQVTSAPFTGTCEIWRMFYNTCTKQLIGFGGGIFNPNSIQLIADTNLTSSTAKNFNGYGNPTDCCNDVTSVDMDANGDFYALMSSYTGLPSVNNRLQKSLNSATYNPPCAFDVSTNSNFEEGNNYGIPGFSGTQVTVRSNAVSVNSSYVFSYDGRILIAWSKTTGANLGSVIVNAGYANGKNRTHEGIDSDDCNNVYVGGANQVHVYSFNGTVFTAAAPLTSTISGDVYDVCLGPMSKIYVCGAGFVSELQLAATPCNLITLTTSSTNANCNSPTGSASVTVSGGTAPYTYLWNPGGQTTSAATGLSPGSYTVMVTDASPSCNPNANASMAIVTVASAGSFSLTGTQSNITCSGAGNGSATASVTGGTAPYTYVWSPSGGTAATASGLTAGSYTATVTDASGCTFTQTFSITQPAALTASVSSTPTSCGSNNGTATVNASGGTGILTYNWTPGGQATPTASGLGAGIYTATVTDANGCTTTQTVAVTQPSSIAATSTAMPTPCGLSNGTATAAVTGGSAPYTYSWSPGGQTSSTVTGLGAGIYLVVVSDANGCTSAATVTVTSTGGATANVSSNVSIAQGQNTTLAASGGGNYSWSTGETNSQIVVAPSLTTIYCVTVFDTNNCSDTACVIVYVGETDCSPAVTGALFMPNSFSPNNDGENDVINIYFGNMNCIKTFELRVYGRWGELVFEATDPVAQWNGLYNGKPLGTGAYAFYMKAELITGEEIIKKGNISLIR